MKVNPYMAFDPLPGVMTLEPPLDRWTETVTDWTSEVTKAFNQDAHRWGGTGNGVLSSVNKSSAVENITSTTVALEFLRQIDVKFTVSGFGPGEILDNLTFDGIDATPKNEIVAYLGDSALPSGCRGHLIVEVDGRQPAVREELDSLCTLLDETNLMKQN